MTMDTRVWRGAPALAGASALLAITLAAGPATHSATEIRVGPNVQVSRARSGDAHYEVLAAADPTNPARLIVGAIHRPEDSTREGGTIVYTSIDGGETWTPTLENGLEMGSDPACTYGPDGAAFYVASVLPPGSAGPTRNLKLFRSDDGGMTWQRPTVLTYADREYVSVDATGGRYHGRIYIHGNSRVPIGTSGVTIFSSADGGKTFTGPAQRANMEPADSMGNAVVTSDGAFVAVFTQLQEPKAPDKAIAWIKVSRSIDGGATLEPAVVVSDAVLAQGRKGTHNNTLNLPSLAGDQTGRTFKDRLYVAWPDQRSGHTDIYFSYSRDGGRTWSAARAINDTPTIDRAVATDQFMPALAVNRDGVLGVLWYDRRDHPDNMGWDARFTASVDGGETFRPSVRVSESGTMFGATERWIVDPRVTPTPGEGLRVALRLSTFTFLGGDTAGLVADAAGVFHPVWVDSRTGTPQVWTAAVTMGREAGQDATQRSVARQDISQEVTLEMIDTEYDRATNVLTVRARLRNVSERAIEGPIRVRVSALESELGDPSIGNADNGGRAAGAEWDFTPQLVHNRLQARGTSRLKTLVFTLTNLRPFREGDRYRTGLVQMDLMVFGAHRR